MRVIAGDFKGRKLETPEGESVRPTSDKVKEAMFSIAMNHLYDSVCIDLFSGSGSLGIEAISRGASKCYFCDSQKSSMSYIKKNVKHCGCIEQSAFLLADYRLALKRINETADIIFLDPPYESGYYDIALEMIDSLDLLGSKGIIIAEHNSRLTLPDAVGNLKKMKVRKYGTMSLSIYQLGDKNND